MTAPKTIVIGNESLTLHCAEILQNDGFDIVAFVSSNHALVDWAKARNIAVMDMGDLSDIAYDWLFSIANLDIIPNDIIGHAAKGAINFHDGPLPDYAGVNVPVWAILNDHPNHAITWHYIDEGVDTGDIIHQVPIEIADDETALSLNAKCYAAGIDSFPNVISAITSAYPTAIAQRRKHKNFYTKSQKPDHYGAIDFNQSADQIVRLVNALDHGEYMNPVCCPKILVNGQVWLIGSATTGGSQNQTIGKIVHVTNDIEIACLDGSVILGDVRDSEGRKVDPSNCVSVGDTTKTLKIFNDDPLLKAAIKAEKHWRPILQQCRSASLLLSQPETAAASVTLLKRPGGIGDDQLIQAIAAVLQQASNNQDQTIALFQHKPKSLPFISPWVPIHLGSQSSGKDVANQLEQMKNLVNRHGQFCSDLLARFPSADKVQPPTIAIHFGANLAGFKLAFAINENQIEISAPSGYLDQTACDILGWRLEAAMDLVVRDQTDGVLGDLNLLTDQEHHLLVKAWNATGKEVNFTCLHKEFERQVARTPDATALVFMNQSITYRELNQRANAVAHKLVQMDQGRGDYVGLHVARSPDLLIGALGILKAGAAYVPLDPNYPADRIELYIADSGLNVVVTQSAIQSTLPETAAKTFTIDAFKDRMDDAPNVQNTLDDLAYLIYTSGSTGRPKGVMIEHQNVSNFFSGMDDILDQSGRKTWLSVTSPSFDISVLELFWTLTRGFKVVLSDDENRTLVGSDIVVPRSDAMMDFSLFYWGNDDGIGRDKYRLLLEGAKFADQNGFCAVWTPERHFHAFGGPYPNPSVTGAAVAGITKNISVRAGSCVAPLHHTARIAEEWAVIDNLTNGRAGLAIASGWQPDDFVLRPENTPPENKPAMMKSIEELRALWRGESVNFKRQDGSEMPVVTQPRPVSKELEIWVTTAGNPETWKEAGRIGAHVLTHLLGQTVDEVAEKIKIYHDALREAGHDPKDFKVSLMLHSFLAADKETAREIAMNPMKDYLRSAAGLIKQYAWAFPAFKKPKGVENPFQIDLDSLSDEELDGILEFAFERYFETSGLFGTRQDALDRVQQVQAIGVTEIACLIDYGINVDEILSGLEILADVVEAVNGKRSIVADDDFSIAGQMVRHKASHIQCTPSMARMLSINEASRAALSGLDQFLIGGEALPTSLEREIRSLTKARVDNMYGPTETTIWSTSQHVKDVDGAIVPIGKPISNTQVYVLDETMSLVPAGAEGELYIAGKGVSRGYWQSEDLTAERFLPDPFSDAKNAKMYRTGDVVRWQSDGNLEFIGRADHQIKLRGFRVELGEIEAAFEAHPAITQAVVIATGGDTNASQLVAYYTSSSDTNSAELRTSVGSVLPAHMVPSRIVRISEFPLTPNKKVDRKALASIKERQPAVLPSAQNASRATTSAGTLEAVRAIWMQALNVEIISNSDNFFEIGGHSILAVQAHRDIRAKLGVDALKITDVFRFPVLSRLAQRIDELSPDRAETKQAPLEKSPSSDTTDRLQMRNDVMARRRAMRSRKKTGV